MNAMKRVTSVARMRLVQTRKDLTNAGANMVSMVTATTAQVSQCFIFLLKILNRITRHFFSFVECLRIFCVEELMFIQYAVIFSNGQSCCKSYFSFRYFIVQLSIISHSLLRERSLTIGGRAGIISKARAQKF